MTWKFTQDPRLLSERLFGKKQKTKEGQISLGVATRKGKVRFNLDLSQTLQDIPDYLDSSVHYQIPYLVSDTAVKITSFSFSTLN